MINISSMGNYYVRKVQNQSNKEAEYYWRIFAFDKCSVECGIGRPGNAENTIFLKITVALC